MKFWTVWARTNITKEWAGIPPGVAKPSGEDGSRLIEAPNTSVKLVAMSPQ